MLVQAVNPLLPQYNATMMSGAATNLMDFTSHYSNLFSALPPATETWSPTLTYINQAAQLYYQQTGQGSANGIKTLCMFSADETLMAYAAEGVRMWIAAENARRVGVDDITVLVDMVWSEGSTGLYFDYAADLLQCPDSTDIMLLQGGTTTGLDVASALRYSELRPKAVLGLDPRQDTHTYHSTSTSTSRP